MESSSVNVETGTGLDSVTGTGTIMSSVMSSVTETGAIVDLLTVLRTCVLAGTEAHLEPEAHTCLNIGVGSETRAGAWFKTVAGSVTVAGIDMVTGSVTVACINTVAGPVTDAGFVTDTALAV